MGGALFLPCSLAWDQTMVEVMKIMATSFKRSYAHNVALSTPNPASGHCRPTSPPEIPGHSQESLGQSLVGSLLLSPRFWCTQVSICPVQEAVSPVLCKFWQLCGGLMATYSKRAYARPRSTTARALRLNRLRQWLIKPKAEIITKIISSPKEPQALNFHSFTALFSS